MSNYSTSDVVYSNDSCPTIELSVDAAESLLYTDLQVAIFRFVLPIVFVFGVLNNVAFIYVVVHSQSMQTITNKCLVHLSIADLLFLIVAIGERFWSYLYSPITPDDTPYGVVGCSTFKLARSASYFASLAFVTVVSIERFNAVCRYQRKRDATTYRNIIIGCWLASFVLSLTFIPSVSILHCNTLQWPEEPPFQDFGDREWFICLPQSDWQATYTDAMQAIPFFFLLIANLCLYVCIIRGLNAAVKRADLTGKRLRNTAIRNQIAWMLIANGVIFFTLLSPREISFIIKSTLAPSATHTDFYTNISEITSILSYINSGINPIVYSILSSKHRKAFQDAFLPEKCSPRPEKSANCAGYLQPIVGQTDETSMGYRHSPRLGVRTERTETETV